MEDRPKLAVLHLLGQTEDVGGVLSVVRNLQEATRGAGVAHRVWVHSSYRENRQPALDYVRSRFAWDEPPGWWEMARRTPGGVGDLRRLLRKQPAGVVHAHTRGGLLAGLGLWASQGCRLLFTNHAYARHRWLYRCAARLPGIHTVVLTRNMARYYGLRPNQARVHLIPACCADATLAVPLVRRRPDRSRPIRLIGLGTLLPWKNWRLLLQAMAQLPADERNGLRFEHWGETAQTEESRRYAAELSDLRHRLQLGEHVIFHGAISAVVERLLETDWMVLPSTNEPCSVALSEAMATGIPVLASRSGGNVDLVEEERNGLLFEPGSVADLVRALRRILLGLATLLPPEGIRDTMRSRTAAAVGQRYLALYDRLAGRRVEGESGPARLKDPTPVDKHERHAKH